MKTKINFLILALAAFLSFGCQKHYEARYDLAVDAHAYELPCTGSSFPLYIYCSGEWMASFDREVDWVSFEDGISEGRGTGVVHLAYLDNDDAPREVNIVIRSGDFEQQVHLRQLHNTTHLEIQ